MTNIEYSDGIGSRGRNPFLLFVRGDEIIPFAGSDILPNGHILNAITAKNVTMTAIIASVLI